MRICHCTLGTTNPRACEVCSSGVYDSGGPGFINPIIPGQDALGKVIVTQPTQKGWVCPKCGRVYAYWVSECRPCNEKVSEKEAQVNIAKNDSIG
jgi:predicted RNA-binding Zn-ribbon protein involved in translation (DUF1610 family)